MTDTVSKLYLELSALVPEGIKTARELRLEERVAGLEDRWPMHGSLAVTQAQYDGNRERLETAEARVAELEAKCRRLEGQPREAWERRLLVSGDKTMCVYVWFPESVAPKFVGECLLMSRQEKQE